MEQKTPSPEEYSALINLYQKDIGIFAEQVFGVTLTPKQIEICRAFQDNRLVTVRGGIAAGKSMTMAVLAWWGLLCFDEILLSIFGTTEQQLKTGVIRQMTELHGKMVEPFKSLYECGSEKFYRKVNTSSCFCQMRLAREENPDAARGLHQKLNWVFVDEATGVSDEILQILLNVLSDPFPRILLVSNPSKSGGFFWKTHHDELISKNWVQIHTTLFDSPNYDPERFKQLVSQYGGVTSRQYRVMVEGEFPIQNESGLIPREHVEYAVQNECFPPENAPIIWGLDPAGQGADSSVLCIRQDNKVLEFKQWNDLNPTQLAYAIKDLYERTPKNQRPVVISIDANGLGYGVYSAVKDLGLPAYECKFAGTPTRHPERYSRVRDQLYAEMADWFAGENVQIPNNAKLIEELCSVQFEDASGKIKIEKKEQIRKRIGRSPDFSDALGLTFAVSRTRYASKYNWGTKIVYDHLRSLE